MNHAATSASTESLMFSLIHAARTLEARLEGSLGELAARLSRARSNVTQLVDRLEAEGLVRRVADPEARRSVRADLTRGGEERQVAGKERRRAYLASEEGVREVEAQIAAARRLGIRAVPTFVFDGQCALQGAQPVPAFRRALEEVEKVRFPV